MRLRFVGSTSTNGGCPSVYETDRGTYVVQGMAVTDCEALSCLRDVLAGEGVVEVPGELFRFAPKLEE